jgi:small subunit ribosomal protein S16
MLSTGRTQPNIWFKVKRFLGMVKIRLARGGAKKRPFYHIVVADARSKRDGRRIERIGFFNPLARGQEERLRLDLERVDYWTGVGAQLSERVQNLVTQARSSAAA